MIFLLLFFLLVAPPVGAVDVRLPVPEIPGNGIDDDLNGTIDPAVANVWTASGANYYVEGESCVKGGNIATVSGDDTASNSSYVHLPLTNHFSTGQIQCPGTTLTNDTYYVWALVRNPGSAKRIWWNSSVIGRYPDNATLGATIPQCEKFCWMALGRADTLENFRLLQNGTAQGTVALSGAAQLYIATEPGIQIDRIVISPDINTDPASVEAVGGGTFAYEWLDIGTDTMPNAADNGVIDAVWARVPAVTYTGTNTGLTVMPTTRCVWDKDASPKRFACLHTYTLANLTSTQTVDDSDLSGDTAFYAYFKFSNLDRERDTDTYQLGVNMNATQALLDASWPSGTYDTTHDFANCSKGRSYTANVLVIEVACDLPAVTNDQSFLLHFLGNERVTGTATTRWLAFSNLSNPADINGWGVAKLSTTSIPGGADETAPTVNNCTSLNIGTTTFDAQCDINEGGTAFVRYDTDNDGAVSGADMVQTSSVNCSGATCTINISGQTAGAHLEWAMTVTDAAQNAGTSAVIDVDMASGNERYVSVSGSGTEAGTSCADTNDTTRCPISQIGARATAGETWIIKDGTYTATSSSTALTVNCASNGTGAGNGTQSNPVIVKAENERLAYIKSNGQVPPVLFENCSWWVVEGLRAGSQDRSQQTASLGHFFCRSESCSNFVLRRNLVHTNNRYGNNGMLGGGFHNSLIEENEVYDFHRNGLTCESGSICRRNYVNSRSRDDIAGGFPSGWTDTGDESINAYPGSNTIVENNIAENGGAGYQVNASDTTVDNRFYGNIAYTQRRGVGITARGNTLAKMPRSTYFENLVVVDSGTSAGFEVQAAKDTRCDNCSIINNSGHGFYADNANANFVGDGVHTFYADNSLSWDNSGTGFFMVGLDDFLIDFPNSFANGTAFNPVASNPDITNELTVDPSLGGCFAFIRDASPMKGAGKGGADIGANILYATENGVLTTKKFWDSSTGNVAAQFIGATVNDADLNTETNGLADFGSRFNAACASWPAGY